MENNLFNYLLIPEIFFTILLLLLILIGLFKKNDSGKDVKFTITAIEKITADTPKCPRKSL